MLFYYKKLGKELEVLSDLIKINNDRIAGYQLALDQTPDIDIDLQEVFKKIIADSKYFKQQLSQKLNETDGDTRKKATTILGKIYKAWMDLKVAFSYSTQKAIISSCMYNEEIALHAYKAALSTNTGIPAEIRQTIEEQANALSKVYYMLKKYHDVKVVMNHRLVYFN